MSIPFWYNDPSILLNKKHIYSVWPSSCMEYNERMNAITRLVIILTVIGYVLTNQNVSRIFYFHINGPSYRL